MPRVYLGQTRVDLHPADLVGSGGEGSVYQIQDSHRRLLAIKLYHQPTARKAEKLKALLARKNSFPQEVVAPLELVFDQGDHILGFAMRLLPSGRQVFEMLFNRRHREVNHIGGKDVTTLFIRLHQVVQNVHQLGIVIGDLNPLNEFYLNSEIFLTDVDSFQIGQFPCGVATERCLEPRLYGIDLSLRPVFLPNDDWYAFCVLLFNSLLLVHPYGGAHPRLRTIARKALTRMTVFDSSVTYPISAYPPEIISDSLRELFEKVFVQGWRGSPGVGVLEEYQSLLIGCPNCGLWYPNSRKVCPGCREANRLVLRVKTVTAGIEILELISAKGPILFTKVVGSLVYCVALEKGETVLYLKEPLEKVKRKILFREVTGARFDIFDRYLVVCPEPLVEKPELVIFDIAGDLPVLITSLVSEKFAGHGVVFRGSAECLYRLVGGLIFQGRCGLGKEILEKMVATSIKEQTWFDADTDPGRESLFGYFRVFQKYEWFYWEEGKLVSIAISPLKDNEEMIDRAVRFSASSVLLLRRTLCSGIEFCRLDLFDRNSGELKSSRQVKLSENPQFNHIHSVAFARSTILIPTDEGLVAESAENGTQRLFVETANLVSSADYLWPYEEGVLVISRLSNKVFKITLKR